MVTTRKSTEIRPLLQPDPPLGLRRRQVARITFGLAGEVSCADISLELVDVDSLTIAGHLADLCLFTLARSILALADDEQGELIDYSLTETDGARRARLTWRLLDQAATEISAEASAADTLREAGLECKSVLRQAAEQIQRQCADGAVQAITYLRDRPIESAPLREAFHRFTQP